jgi:hypothetical protein
MEVIMEKEQEITLSRKNIFVRLLYTVLYLVIFEILKLIIQITVVFQYIYLLITLSHNDSIRNFSNKVSTYTYEVIRYLTLNANPRPFPFNDFPAEKEPPVEQVVFR